MPNASLANYLSKGWRKGVSDDDFARRSKAVKGIAIPLRGAALLLCCLLSGCGLPPAIPVLGASFPAWFFCFLAAALLLIPCHLLIVRKGWQARFSPLVISYLALLFLFAALFWFLLF